MFKRILVLMGLLALLSWGAPRLFADHGDHGNHGNHGNHGKHGNKHEDEGWDRRDGYEYRVYEGNERPPGWGHGKKTGWGNCGMPPGQAKKHGCQAYTYEGRQYYYHQDDEGRIVAWAEFNIGPHYHHAATKFAWDCGHFCLKEYRPWVWIRLWRGVLCALREIDVTMVVAHASIERPLDAAFERLGFRPNGTLFMRSL